MYSQKTIVAVARLFNVGREKPEGILTEYLLRHRVLGGCFFSGAAGKTKWPADLLTEYRHHMCSGIGSDA